MIKSFYTAGMLMDVLTTFGPISEDVSGIFGGVSGQGSVDTYQVTRVPGLSPAKT